MNKGISGCCKDCPDRYPGCHDHCEKYIKASKEWQDYKNMIYEGKRASEYDLHKFRTIEVVRKRRKWHDRKS